MKKITKYILVLALAFGPLLAGAQIITTQNLARGARGAQVTALQKFLATDRSVFSPPYITGYFGVLTEQAVKNFQIKHGLPMTGIVNAQTQALINQGAPTTSTHSTLSITGVFVNATSTYTKNPVVTWNTTAPTKTRFVYDTKPFPTLMAIGPGYSSAPGSLLVSDDSLQTKHGIEVTGLLSSRTYYFIIQSTDQAGNITSSSGSFLNR